MDIANIEKVEQSLRRLRDLKYCLLELDRAGGIDQLNSISKEHGLNFKLPLIDEMKADLKNQTEVMIADVLESMKEL